MINVNKKQLIEKIQANKENHIKEYAQAVEDYKAEARRQIEVATKSLEEGKLDIRVSLVTPKNEAAEYDKLVEMFEWDTREEVELSQREFNEYILDETSFAIQAKLQNSTYSSLR